VVPEGQAGGAGGTQLRGQQVHAVSGPGTRAVAVRIHIVTCNVLHYKVNANFSGVERRMSPKGTFSSDGLWSEG